MEIQTWSIDRPKDYPLNARKWSPKAIAKVAASLKEYGWRQPIVVDEADVIVIGHLRRTAARSIGFAECPVHVARDLSPEQIRGLRLADNRTNEEATWDNGLLAAEFQQLRAMDFNLSATGFELAEIDRLVSGTSSPEPALPAQVREIITRAGDIWQIGSHRLLCGDCRNAATMDRVFGGAHINMVFTSPPYASQRDYDASSGFQPVATGDYVAWFSDVSQFLARMLAPDGSYGLLGCGQRLKDGGDLARPSNVLDLPTETGMGSHSAPFPRPLVEFFVKAFTDPGDIVFDPFMGSGTTIAAAETLKRRAMGVEISPAYCDIIVKRIEQLTGVTASRADGPQ